MFHMSSNENTVLFITVVEPESLSYSSCWKIVMKSFFAKNLGWVFLSKICVLKKYTLFSVYWF